MQVNWIWFVVLLILSKSSETFLEVVLKKFWEWVLSDDNLKQLTRYFKLKMLVLYLDWLLQQNLDEKLPKK